MIRFFFWLVLLANLLLFAYMQWGGALTGTVNELQALPPLNAEKVRLLPASAAASAVAATSHSAAAPAPAAPAPAAPAPAAQVVQATPAACMEWGEFSGDDLARATMALTAMKLGRQLRQHEVEQDSGYWVYMPPQTNHAGAERKVAELKALGVKDYFVVQDGKWKNAISLGVFRTQEAAQNYLDKLRAQGVRTAVVGERQAKLRFTVFVFKNPDSALTARVVALQKGFPDSELKAVPCN